MNPRQRRGVLLLLLAGVGALALVLGLGAYIADVQEQLGPMATQLRLTEDVAYLEPIESDMVEEVEIPERWLSSQAVSSSDGLVGMVAATDLTDGAMLQESALREPPTIRNGEREVAILIDPETGVGGKIQAGDIVDVYATYGATKVGEGEQERDVPPRAEVVLEKVHVVAVSAALQVEDGEDFGREQAVPVTFALDSRQALRLAYAESFANEVRLGLRLRTDSQSLTRDDRVYSEG